MTGRRRERLVLLVLGVALGARIASPLTSQLDALVAVVLVFAVALVLVLPRARPRPMSRRELADAVKEYTEHERRKLGDHDSGAGGA